MKPREFDPRRLEVRAFAAAAAELDGIWPLAGFERLLGSLAPLAEPVASSPVTWQARGEEVAVRGGVSEVWLHLQAQASLPLVCQRCLGPVEHAMTLDRRFLFVADEGQAAELDAELEHDVLVFSRELDVHQLLEDELLLDLPLVPRHDACPQPLVAAEERAADTAREHPFAALASLRQKQR